MEEREQGEETQKQGREREREPVRKGNKGREKIRTDAEKNGREVIEGTRKGVKGGKRWREEDKDRQNRRMHTQPLERRGRGN